MILQTSITELHKLKKLVNEMRKPENFTYLDLVSLSYALDDLELLLNSKQVD